MARARTLTLATDVKVTGAAELTGLGRTLQKTGGIMTALVTGPIALLGGAAIEAASDLNESMNAINVVFGDAADTVEEFGAQAAKSAGLSQRAFNELVTPIGAALQNVGFSADEAADASINLAQRAADMASVFNTDVSRALSAIQAGLRGEADPLEKFGVGLSDAAVNAKAVALGLAETEAAVTPLAKSQARLALILEQTSDLQGDFANTSDEAANAQRILASEAENTAAAIGQKLLPIQNKLLNVAKSLLDAFNNLTPKTQDFILAIGGVAAAMGPVLLVLGSLSRVIGFLIKHWGPLSTAMTTAAGTANTLLAAFGPLGVVMGLFAQDVGGAKTTFDTIEDFKAEATAKGWDVLSGAIKDFLGIIEEELPKAPKTADREFTNFTTTIHNHLLAAKGVVEEEMPNVGAPAGDLPQIMADELLANQFVLTGPDGAIQELVDFMDKALTPAEERFNARAFLASDEYKQGLNSGIPAVEKKAREMGAAAEAVLADVDLYSAAVASGFSFGAGLVDPAVIDFVSRSAARLAAAARGIFPGSEPKDPNSPLRGITTAFGFGEVLAQGILSGKDAVARAARTVAGVGFGVPAMATAGVVPIGGTGTTVVNNYFTFNGTSAGGPNELSDTLRRLAAIDPGGQVRYG